jgi:hypothetical protein
MLSICKARNHMRLRVSVYALVFTAAMTNGHWSCKNPHARIHRSQTAHLQVLLHLVVGELAANEPLHRTDCVCRVGHSLPLGREPDQPLALVRECDNGRCCASAFRVFNDARTRALHHRHARVGRAQVDPNHLPLNLAALATADCARQAGGCV